MARAKGSTQFASMFRKLDEDLKKTVRHNPQLYKDYTNEVRERLRENIDTVMLGRDWGEGKQISTGRVTQSHNENHGEVRWTGRYIQFIEYGTGIQGWDLRSNPYPGIGGMFSDFQLPTASYSPRPYGHKFTTNEEGDTWGFYTPDASNRFVLSQGWDALAPYYKTVMAEHLLGYTYFNKRIRELVTKEDYKRKHWLWQTVKEQRLDIRL